MRTIRYSLLGLCTALVLTGAACGGEKPSLDTTQSRPPAGSASSAPPGEADEPVRLTGTVAEGAEENCLILDTGEELYLLLGGDREQLAPRKRVVVTGVLEPDTVNSCMEGTPLRVDEVSEAE